MHYRGISVRGSSSAEDRVEYRRGLHESAGGEEARACIPSNTASFPIEERGKVGPVTQFIPGG